MLCQLRPLFFRLSWRLCKLFVINLYSAKNQRTFFFFQLKHIIQLYLFIFSTFFKTPPSFLSVSFLFTHLSIESCTFFYSTHFDFDLCSIEIPLSVFSLFLRQSQKSKRCDPHSSLLNLCFSCIETFLPCSTFDPWSFSFLLKFSYAF